MEVVDVLPNAKAEGIISSSAGASTHIVPAASVALDEVALATTLEDDASSQADQHQRMSDKEWVEAYNKAFSARKEKLAASPQTMGGYIFGKYFDPWGCHHAVEADEQVLMTYTLDPAMWREYEKRVPGKPTKCPVHRALVLTDAGVRTSVASFGGKYDARGEDWLGLTWNNIDIEQVKIEEDVGVDEEVPCCPFICGRQEAIHAIEGCYTVTIPCATLHHEWLDDKGVQQTLGFSSESHLTMFRGISTRCLGVPADVLMSKLRECCATYGKKLPDQSPPLSEWPISRLEKWRVELIKGQEERAANRQAASEAASKAAREAKKKARAAQPEFHAAIVC